MWGPKDVKTSKTNMMRITANFEEFVTVLCTMASNIRRSEYSGERAAAGRVIFQINFGKPVV